MGQSLKSFSYSVSPLYIFLCIVVPFGLSPGYIGLSLRIHNSGTSKQLACTDILSLISDQQWLSLKDKWLNLRMLIKNTIR